MVSLQFFGHAFFKINFSSGTFLIDPFVYCEDETKRLVKCHHSAKKIKKVDAILITHEHFDHFDKKAVEEFCEKHECCVIAHESVLNELNIEKNLKRPVVRDQVLNIKGVEIKAVPVQHPQSFYPLGYQLISDDVKILHAGDSYLSTAFNNLKSNIVLFPIGGKYTMDVIDAVKAVKNMKPDIAIPMSFNTFDFIEASPDEFKERIDKSILKTKPIVLKPGENFSYKP